MTAAVPAFSSGSFIPTLPYEPQQTGSSSSSSIMTAAAADGVDSCTADPTGSSVKGCDAVSWPVGNPPLHIVTTAAGVLLGRMLWLGL